MNRGDLTGLCYHPTCTDCSSLAALGAFGVSL